MTANRANPLSASSLTRFMTASLPKSTDTQLRNPYDTIALLCHACMIAVGFRLIGLGEEHKIEAPSEADSTTQLPEEWNAAKSSDYAFRYAHTQSSLHYLVKVSRLGGKAVINGLGVGDDKVQSVDIPVKDFISESSLPYTMPEVAEETQIARSLQDLFISEGRITDFASLLKVNIIQKLAPSLQKEGYEESAHAASQAAADSQGQPGVRREPDESVRDPLRDHRQPLPAQPRPYGGPLPASPRRPFPTGDFPPPDFEDEYEINRPMGGGERHPLNIGERDLYPPGLGPHDPLRSGGYGPFGGIGGGGMHPTFDDPMFGGHGGAGVPRWDSRAPPGARYDPVGPGDGLPNPRGGPQFPGTGGRPHGSRGGGGPNPFGGFSGNDFI